MSRRVSGQRGATLIEVAFVLPVLLLLALGGIDLGRLLFTQITLNEAVQEGSLYVARNPSDPAGARTRVVASVDDPTLLFANVAVECPTGANGPVRVTVQHAMDLITPVFGGGSVTLDAEITGDRLSSDLCAASP